MNAFWKTLFGDRYTVGVVLLALILAMILLHSPWSAAVPYLFPVLLMSGIFWMAKRQGS
ncbi:MAG: hypothetical protein K0041_05380 [Acidithiobacillus sp.]|nr:hypothetical protein [Acidithiobacillus sp.]MCE5394591.1 hypothetical protein [Acidithiobacillus sp.]